MHRLFWIIQVAPAYHKGLDKEEDALEAEGEKTVCREGGQNHPGERKQTAPESPQGEHSPAHTPTYP